MRKRDERQTVEKGNHGDDGERRKGIARRKSEAHVRRRNEGAGKETERGDIESGPPKLRRNGGSSSSRHP